MQKPLRPDPSPLSRADIADTDMIMPRQRHKVRQRHSSVMRRGQRTSAKRMAETLLSRIHEKRHSRHP